MKNRIKYVGIPILILVANYVAVSPLMSYLTSVFFLKKGVYFAIIVIAIFFSGWIMLGDQKKSLWIAAVAGVLVYFIGEGILKGLYYYITLTLKPADTAYPEGYAKVESLLQVYWGMLFAPIAAIVSLLGGLFRNFQSKNQRGRDKGHILNLKY
jgi:hypothetical protein